MSDKPIVRLLVPDHLARYLSRRLFLRRVGLGAATLGLGGFAAACGGDDDDDAEGDGGGDGTTTSAAASDGSAGGAVEGTLSVYSWAEYSDPANFEAFTSEVGPTIALDNYDSNEAMIAKLELAGGSAGYDIVVPTSGFLTQMVDKSLLMELDMSKIPNAANQDQAIVELKNAPTHDPGGKYAVVKDWGSTGYLYDTTVIEEELADWADFFRAAALPNVTGLVSVL